MVHVLTGVLQKVYAALRPGGLLLLTQPASAITGIEGFVNNARVFQADLNEPNFAGVLRATKMAIANVIETGLFAPLATAIVPTAEGEYLYDQWDSVDAWFLQTQKLSIDPEPLMEMAAAIRKSVGNRSHRLRESYKEEQLLFRKQGKA